MKKKIFKITKWLLLILLIIFIVKGCIPTKLDVPQMKQRVTTQYWNLPSGSKIAYTMIEGKGTKKTSPIIYLHGGPGGYVYTKNIEILGKLSELGYDVYLYDQIGSGLSGRLEKVKEYTANRHKKDLEEIVNLLGAKKVILIGQSWGGALAVLFAADNLDKTDKLIFTCPGAIKPVNDELEKVKSPDSLQLKEPYNPNAKAIAFALNPRYISISIWARFFGTKLASDKEADSYLTKLATVFTKGLVYDSSKAIAEEGGAGCYSNLNTSVSYGKLTDPRINLKKSKIPILVLKGQYDNINWGYTKEYLDLFTNHKLKIIPSAGHEIFVEQPEIYLNEIKIFLEN
ncbi:proline iminopeptidase [Flavobacterium sp. CG_9.10]|uniref:alpha/beta hydrolase n=1 Tax=Flavobacterium sp. CG_9.10 TaxID=2787729 RepID=UPI0018C96B75|nr:alpha/beta hydrolase [Flavobacterium sp. CG_9.10]MBG6110198.1 proline iminopeptidase [Flavobacterium sp. CG_9.10]